MIKLKNPFDKDPDYFCFGCSSKNHQGLKMTFFEDGEEIISFWEPDIHFQSYINIVHGGIQSTLMDELASWVVFIKLQTGGVTTKLTTKFRKSVEISSGRLTLRAKLLERTSRIATIQVKLYNGNNELCSESLAEYFVLPQEKAVSSMHIPSIGDFYE